MALKPTPSAVLDAIATIRVQYVDDAVAAYDRDATPAMRGLLDARPYVPANIDKPLALGKPLPPEGV